MLRFTLVSLQASLPPLGLAYIAAYIKKYGGFNEITILENDSLLSVEKIVRRIIKTRPDVVGLSSMTLEFIKATTIAKKLKLDQPDLITLIGGVHITALPQTLPKSFDSGVIGEGEETTLELLKTYEKTGFTKDALKKIEGIAFHNDGKVIINNRRNLIGPVDKIPFPDRDLLDMKRHVKPKFVFSNYRRRGTYMLTSRGCPYKCTFCYNPTMWQKARFFSPEYVIEEIKEIIEKYKVEAINIYDDLFVLDRKRIEKIAQLIREERINEKIEFFCLCRSNIFDEKIAQILRSMNVVGVSFGFESGSEKILNYLKKGTVTVEDNKRAVQICKKYGMSCDPSFIIGSPGETKEDIMKTYDFIIEQDLKSPAVYILTPYPGTELWDSLKAKGMVNESMDWNKFTIDLCSDLKNKRIVVADNIKIEELQDLANKLHKEMLKRQWGYYNFKFRDIFSTIYVQKFLTHPKKFSQDLFKLIYYKMKKFLVAR